jgi:hypothetical protein
MHAYARRTLLTCTPRQRINGLRLKLEGLDKRLVEASKAREGRLRKAGAAGACSRKGGLSLLPQQLPQQAATGLLNQGPDSPSCPALAPVLCDGASLLFAAPGRVAVAIQLRTMDAEVVAISRLLAVGALQVRPGQGMMEHTPLCSC